MTRQKLYLIVLAFILAFTIQSQLLAIDFGTQFIKASLVHSGAGKSFSIVENSKSERKFLNAVGFFNEQRFYETDALSKRTKVPQNCFLYSRMLIDLVAKPSLVTVVKKDLFLEYINEKTENQFMAEFILKNFPQQTNEVTLLQVMTMMLKYVKTQAQKFAKNQIKDVVLILPNYWTIHQRNFLLQAASVAQIYILSIVSENTAASINYALSQRTNNNTENVLFYNVGSNALQMTLVEYRQVLTQSSPKPIESIFIKDDYGRPYVGGLRLDAIISKYFEQIFQQKHKKKLDKKGLIKLLAQSIKVKQTLTANKQATIFVEGIMDGIDFHSKITRAEFEKRSEGVFKELTSPLKRFLLDNDLKADDLHSVELIGGGTRIPKLQSMIVQILNNQKQKIGTHINADEAMALGGAFFAANSSKKFKVKGMNLYDGFNFDIRLVLRNLEEDITSSDKNYFYKNATIFKKKSRYGLNKEVNFKCLQNLRADLYRVDVQTQQQELLKSYEFDQIQSFNESDFKLSLIFTIDPMQVVQLKDSRFTYKKDEIQTYLQKVKKAKPTNATQQKQRTQEKRQEQQAGQEKQPKSEQSSSQKESQQEQKQAASQKSQSQNSEKQEAQQSEQDKIQAQKSTSQQNSETQKDNKSKKSEDSDKSHKKNKKKQEKIEYQTVEKNKTVTKKYEKELKTKISFNIKKLEENMNERTRKMLKNYENAEQKKRALAEVRNKLQALIYQTVDKLGNQEFIKYSKSSERQHLKKLAEEKEEWHDQSSSKNPEDYKKQYNELYKPLDRIKRRIIQDYERSHIKDQALKIVKEHLNLTQKIQKGKQWITDQQVQDLKDTMNQADSKINEIFKAMEDTDINEDTVYKNKDMIKQAENAKDKYFTLKAKPKPAKKQEKKSEETSEEETAESEKSEQKSESKEQQTENVGQDDEL